MVSMYILSKNSVRVRNENKGKRKRNKKVNSRNIVEESFFEDIDLNCNNSNGMNLSFQNPVTE